MKLLLLIVFCSLLGFLMGDVLKKNDSLVVERISSNFERGQVEVHPSVGSDIWPADSLEHVGGQIRGRVLDQTLQAVDNSPVRLSGKFSFTADQNLEDLLKLQAAARPRILLTDNNGYFEFDNINEALKYKVESLEFAVYPKELNGSGVAHLYPPIRPFSHRTKSRISAPPKPLDSLRLPGSSLYGRISNHSNYSNLELTLSDPAFGDEYSATSLSTRPNTRTGFFRFQELKAGNYMLSLSSGVGKLNKWPVEITSGNHHFEKAAAISPHRENLSIIDVVGPDGGAETKVREFYIRSGIGKIQTKFIANQFEREGGRYFVRLPLAFRLGSEQYWEQGRSRIAVYHGGLGGEVEVEADNWRGPHKIQLQATGSLKLDFPDYIGSGYEARIVVRVEELVPRREPWQRPDKYAPNYYSQIMLNELRLQEYTISAYCRCLGPNDLLPSFLYFQKKLAIGSGENILSIPMPKCYKVTIEIPEAHIGSHISIGANSGRLQRGLPSLQKKLQWVLPAGQYCVSIGSMYMSFIVKDQDLELKFAPHEYQLARLVSAPNRYLQELGLKKGDLVTKIDGRTFSALNVEDFIKQQWKESAFLKLEIHRDSERFEIQIDTKLAGQPPRFGGIVAEE